MNIIAQAASGSISLLRLSGPDALKIASSVISPNKSNKLAANPRLAVLTKLEFEGFIDSALVTYFKAPFSFTGEDVVEFSLHGGYAVAERLISVLLSQGARIAEPGEFSKRACLNGKMSVEKALLLNELINAKTENARKIISKNIDRSFYELISATQDEIMLTLAYIETAIDYADDDLPADIMQASANKLEQNAKRMQHIALMSERKRGLIEGFSIAIIGEPNVGKSSLLNALLQSQRAIVSPIAGTTRDSVQEQLNMDGFLLKLIDTAGIREHTDDEIEKIGINISLKAMELADVLVFLADGSKELSQDSARLLELARASGKKLFVVINKADLALKSELAKDAASIKISAFKGQIQPLKDAMIEHFKSFNDEELFLSNAALICAFKDAAAFINEAIAHFSELEMAAFYLNQALKILKIFGKEQDSDELYDAMFSSFCLGK